MKKFLSLLALLPLGVCAQQQQPVDRIRSADLKADIIFLRRMRWPAA